MKLINLLFFGVAIVFELHKAKMIGKCDTDLKSYDITIEFVRPTKLSPHILDYRNLKIVRHNRTTNVVSGKVIFNIDVDQSVDVHLRSYQKKNDELQETFLTFDQSLCSIIESDTFIYPSMVEASDFPSRCPLKAKTYTINNFVIDMRRLPSHIPGTYWLLVANTTQGDQLLSQMEIGTRIDQKMAGL